MLMASIETMHSTQACKTQVISESAYSLHSRTNAVIQEVVVEAFPLSVGPLLRRIKSMTSRRPPRGALLVEFSIIQGLNFILAARRSDLFIPQGQTRLLGTDSH